MKLNHNEFLLLTPPDRAERVSYVMYRYLNYGAEEKIKGISDETVNNILRRQWYKLYNRWRLEDGKIRRFAELTDAKIALDTMFEIHQAGRLDLLSDIAQYTGEYAKLVDKEYGIIRPDAFNRGSNIPTQIRFV